MQANQKEDKYEQMKITDSLELSYSSAAPSI